MVDRVRPATSALLLDFSIRTHAAALCLVAASSAPAVSAESTLWALPAPWPSARQGIAVPDRTRAFRGRSSASELRARLTAAVQDQGLVRSCPFSSARIPVPHGAPGARWPRRPGFCTAWRRRQVVRSRSAIVLIVGWRSAIPTATATAMTTAVNAPRHFSIIEAAENAQARALPSATGRTAIGRPPRGRSVRRDSGSTRVPGTRCSR